jgi:sugar lactone lactonase YvrE
MSVFVGEAPDQQPPIALEALRTVGGGLHRPECVLCTASGDIFSADWRGGVAHIAPDGTQSLYAGPAPGGHTLRPNGIALRADGSFLVTDLSPETGGVFHLKRNGQVRPLVERVDGIDLPPTNFVLEDGVGRIWITVSTRRMPRSLGYRHDNADGFIVLADTTGVRIVADQLGYTNEVAIDPSGRWLYVNETFGRRLSRFALKANGELGVKEVVTEFGTGTFPDGLTFDVAGHAWITSVVSNRVIRVAPDGRAQTLLEDADEAHLARVEAAYLAQEMGRPHLDEGKSRRLKNISSLAFGGPDLKTAHLGCLLGDAIETFPTHVAGHPPPHWHYREPAHG